MEVGNYKLLDAETGIFEEPLDSSESELSRLIIGSCIKIHKELGPGLLESTYEICLEHELLKLGLDVEKQVYLPVNYDGINLNAGYRIDLLVNKKVILELKCVTEISEIHFAQILTYLKLSKCKLGLLINFNEVKVIDGIKRVVNKL